MANLIRQSIVVHRLGTDVHIEFEKQKNIHSGSAHHCRDALAGLILKLEARQIGFKYDDLCGTLRVSLVKRNATRVVEYVVEA